jgi:ABC-2 type transport system ATP-binding protein
MIELEHISKSFNKGTVKALQDISFAVDEGALLGVIGPDGAGKTTLFRILTTLLLPDNGNARVDHLDVRKDYALIRERVGYMPGKFSLYQDLTIAENIHFFATVFGTTLEENYDQIKDIYQQIEPFKNRRAGKLSGGMKQKLALCCALIHKPRVLFLDEPTTGVDVVSRKEFWDMLKKLKQEGITILVSTPYMDEAKLCDRIALIQKGSILSIDTPAAIVASFPGKLFSIRSTRPFPVLQDVRTYPGTLSCFAFGDALHATFRDGADSGVLAYLESKGQKGVQVAAIEPSIEDCFIHLLKD